MEPAPILEQGIALMLFGMGTVFVFLTLLVASATLMSFLVRRLAPAGVAPVLPGAAPVAPPARDADLTAVITAAIHQHRSRQK